MRGSRRLGVGSQGDEKSVHAWQQIAALRARRGHPIPAGERTENDDTGGAVSDLLVLSPRELDHALGRRVGDFDLAQDGVAVVGEPAVGGVSAWLNSAARVREESALQDSAHGCDRTE